MERWALHLATIGEVVRFDYPYAKAGRRAPDRLPVLTSAHRAALVEARRTKGGPAILVGKSMGSRVGCHLALEENVTGLVCLGYPLRGQSGRIRSEVLLALRSPILFVQGTRDALCPLELLEDVRRQMTAASRLHVVTGGDHSLEVGRRELRARGETQDDVDRGVLATMALFVAEVVEDVGTARGS
jgi:uncharacterized protein